MKTAVRLSGDGRQHRHGNFASPSQSAGSPWAACPASCPPAFAGNCPVWHRCCCRLGKRPAPESFAAGRIDHPARKIATSCRSQFPESAPAGDLQLFRLRRWRCSNLRRQRPRRNCRQMSGRSIYRLFSQLPNSARSCRTRLARPLPAGRRTGLARRYSRSAAAYLSARRPWPRWKRSALRRFETAFD